MRCIPLRNLLTENCLDAALLSSFSPDNIIIILFLFIFIGKMKMKGKIKNFTEEVAKKC